MSFPKNKIIDIPIGSDIYTGETVYFPNKYWNVVLVEARSRYGKTVLLKNMVAQIAETRPVVIFDYLGEWKGIQYPNWSASKHRLNKWTTYLHRGINDLTVVEDYLFWISDFKRPIDWITMGAPAVSAKYLALLASNEDLHGNDVDEFHRIIQELPENQKEFEEFKRNYGSYFEGSSGVDGPLPPQTRKAIVNHWGLSIRSLFEGEGRHINDWGKLLRKHPKLLINLKASTPNGQYRARVFTGKIVEQMEWVFPTENPFIVVEEADVIIPHIDEGAEEAYSTCYEFLKITLKLQKYGCPVCYIVQDRNNLFKPIWRNFHILIQGHLPFGANDMFGANKLRWNPRTNERQFLMVEESGKKTRFKPFPPMTT